MKYVIAGNDDYHRMQIFGTKNGGAFNSEKIAKERMEILRKNHPTIAFTLMPITDYPY